MAKKKPAGEKIIAQNKTARLNYFIDDTYEAGIALLGTEVKALREGKANLKDSYALVKDGEVFVHEMHISPYTFGNRQNHDPLAGAETSPPQGRDQEALRKIQGKRPGPHSVEIVL